MPSVAFNESPVRNAATRSLRGGAGTVVGVIISDGGGHYRERNPPRYRRGHRWHLETVAVLSPAQTVAMKYDLSQEQDEFQDEELSNEAGEGLDAEDSGEDQEPDPDFQGVIRTVKGANLVYKRQMPDDTFAELWIMNIGRDMKKESQIKRAILAGTDVDPQSQESPDGKQHMELYSVGNVQFCEITGLSN